MSTNANVRSHLLAFGFASRWCSVRLRGRVRLFSDVDTKLLNISLLTNVAMPPPITGLFERNARTSLTVNRSPKPKDWVSVMAVTAEAGRDSMIELQGQRLWSRSEREQGLSYEER